MILFAFFKIGDSQEARVTSTNLVHNIMKKSGSKGTNLANDLADKITFDTAVLRTSTFRL